MFDHPELTLPAGPERSAAESGFRVQANGTFYYPFVNEVQALGRPPEIIREDLREKTGGVYSEPSA